jgi:phage terminase large subunit
MSNIVITPYQKQVEFFRSTKRYIAFGGARGGGKSWAARTKMMLLALNYAGIQILLLRRTLKELRANHIIPLMELLHDVATYKSQEKEFIFANGSRITLGYCQAESDVLQYQGQAYDVVFMEEATQFSEFQFQSLTESNRSSGICKEKFSPRMYFTMNPGGVGHVWVKRLFIDRNYRNQEQADDYDFIPSKVYDNKFLMENSPEYVRTLENLPEDRRKAMLDGDWDVFDGQYFSEFSRDIHVITPFEIPKNWNKYLSIDYGLDMLACYVCAIDEHGNAYIYKEIYESNLIISAAAQKIKSVVDESLTCLYAPPDLYNRRQDTGKSAIDIFAEHELFFVKASNDRVQGWYNVKEWLRVYDTKDIQTGKKIKDTKLKIFANCTNLIRCLPQLQYSDKNPNDVASEPHEITHAPDALRYLLADRPVATDIYIKNNDDDDEKSEETWYD